MLETRLLVSQENFRYFEERRDSKGGRLFASESDGKKLY